ncbi:hypothetical protein SmJEL517_g01210 [Synchytrium microbalum]|uniref:NADP-dependent oxidoreductase domain-containing protein n=1 Tax=Synchytrium microbalum TaxID=1806994 RepID=A0A507CBN0_9FUNG|nr:uncharacterized protein SmJEL517_g01210 [Synchytrium microbalum]TPX36559.1 hypothetical protein SmJEL517_g01210 [Synchytrium microbalum]
MSTTPAKKGPKMLYRNLGNTGIRVSVLSLGGWVTYGGQVGNQVAFDCMKASYDAGVNFFDTAEGYANGESEKVMGAAIRHFKWPRNTLIISTKIYFGPGVRDMNGMGWNARGLSRKHIVEGLDACLERLGLPYVDVVFAHRPDDTVPMEETVRAFNHVINQGKALYWGTSEWSQEQLTDAWAVADRLGLIGPACEQPQYSMLVREKFEAEYAPLYKKRGLGTTIWSPLASGVLSGKYSQGNIPKDSRFAMADAQMQSIRARYTENAEGKANLAKVDALAPIAKRLNCSLSALALAWCAKNPNVSTVIMGASKVEQIHENLTAISVIPLLTDSVMAEIEKILANKPKQATARF